MSVPNVGLSRLRTTAVWVLGVIVAGAMVVSFVESYHGLYLWASGHKVKGLFAFSWPVMVDAFLLSGEIVLLTSAIGAWSRKTRTLGWFMSLGGLAASVAANAGQVGANASIADHVTGAVPPLAAMASMVAALSITKQTVTTEGASELVPLESVCMHTVGGSVEENIKIAFLHGRDCLKKEPSVQGLSEAFKTPLPAVQMLVNKIKQQQVVKATTKTPVEV